MPTIDGTLKKLGAKDIASTKTLLHEVIPMTGSIVSGTYNAGNTLALGSELNIKKYNLGQFQSVYDYPYLSSSANHIFDMTAIVDPSGSLKNQVLTGSTTKTNMYQSLAQVLVGHDSTGSIMRFDLDGRPHQSDANRKLDHGIVFSFANLLRKDEIKKGTFRLQVGTGSYLGATAHEHVGYLPNPFSSGRATAVDAIDTAGFVSSNADASFTISISTAAGGLGGTAVTVLLDENQNGGHSGAANRITIGTFDGSESDALAASYIIDAINGVATADNARIVYATSGNGQAGHVLGISAAQGTGATKITLTVDRAGTSGNITGLATASGLNIIDVTAFTGGEDGNYDVVTIGDFAADPSVNTYKNNSPAGEYGLLYSGSSASDYASAKPCGFVYYQAGLAILTLTSSVAHAGSVDFLFNDNKASRGNNADGSGAETAFMSGTNSGLDKNEYYYGVTGSFCSGTINEICDHFRHRIYNIEFQNTTELNSTIYFCRANHNEFNYSSNPTYLSGSKIRVKDTKFDPPMSYITTVGLYSADKELLAVAKLSEPLKKTPNDELTLRVRLDY